MRKDIAPHSATLAINGKLCASFLFGFTAWAVWPSTAEWWQFGVMSLMCAVMAVAHLIGAIRLMIKAHIRERQIKAFLKQGRVAGSSELATHDALRQAGMTDE